MHECIFERNGKITEASHSNCFFVRGNTLYTHPQSNLILPGITRGIILDLAPGLGIRCLEKEVEAADLGACEEAFLASTSAEVMPVVRINDHPVGEGRPGKMTRQLQQAFTELIRRSQDT